VETFAKKKIEIIIEAPAQQKVLRVFEAKKILGHTIFPVLAGSGHEGRWDASGLVGNTGRMISVICVLDASELNAVLAEIEPIIRTQIGIVLISDVQVIRRHHF